MKLSNILIETNEDMLFERAGKILLAFKKGEFKMNGTMGPFTLKYEITSSPKMRYYEGFGVGRDKSDIGIIIAFESTDENPYPVHLEIEFDNKAKTPPNFKNLPTYKLYLGLFCSKLDKKLKHFNIDVMSYIF